MDQHGIHIAYQDHPASHHRSNAIKVDLKAEHLVIEGVVVGVIRNGMSTAA
jgi:hypothetical protein